MALKKVILSDRITRYPITDGLLGIFLGTLGIATGIGAIAVIVAYFKLRHRYPYFGVGLLLSWITIFWLIRLYGWLR